MANDPVRVAAFMVASSIALTAVIGIAASFRGGRAPSWLHALGVATAISVIGILFGKYGATFGLPWQIYYSAPALATVLLPPVLFRFTLQRALVYVVLALATAPLIHAAFFYALGWDEYMPFLRLPRLR
jgi:hypothetical protein